MVSISKPYGFHIKNVRFPYQERTVSISRTYGFELETIKLTDINCYITAKALALQHTLSANMLFSISSTDFRHCSPLLTIKIS